MVTDKPGQWMLSVTGGGGGCCKGAYKDHLQSMQSSTQHPNEEITWREQTILVTERNLDRHMFIFTNEIMMNY